MAKLIYVMGASGAGKDSLLGYVRSRLKPEAPVLFAHRYITRPAHAGGENHLALSEQEFDNRLRRGCFAMQWYSHQTWYGLGVEIDHWLSQGLKVVVNGSRAYLNEAARRYPERLIPVLISADFELLRRRLQHRGRESAEQVEQRLCTARLPDDCLQHPRLHRIANNGVLALAGEQLLQLILAQGSQACA
jgi:ribose 1,5-bisphosphokinase